MPNLNAAKKALRKNVHQRAVNDRWRKKIRLAFRATQEAITSQDTVAAQKVFIEVQKTLDKASKHNVINPNKVSRKKSHFQRAIQAIDKK